MSSLTELRDKVEDLRKVTLYFLSGGTSSYLIHRDEVGRFVEASKRLHFVPGKNPHNGEPAARIWKITVAEIECRGPFWWTVPDLMKNGDPAGARIFDGGVERAVFVDEAQVAAWEAENAEADAQHHRSVERNLRALESQEQDGG